MQPSLDGGDADNVNIDGGDLVQRVAGDDDVVGDVVRIEGDYVGDVGDVVRIVTGDEKAPRTTGVAAKLWLAINNEPAHIIIIMIIVIHHRIHYNDDNHYHH